MIVPESRAAIVGTVTHWFEGFTRFVSHGEHHALVGMEPSYIPEGFTETTRTETDNLTVITYADASGSELLFSAVPASGSVAVGNVDMTSEQVFIGNIIYHVFTAEDTGRLNYIVWDTSGCRYYVSALLPTDQLLEIAQSLR